MGQRYHAGTEHVGERTWRVDDGYATLHEWAGVANLELDLFGRLQVVVLDWPGPLAIFTGRWMLIDV